MEHYLVGWVPVLIEKILEAVESYVKKDEAIVAIVTYVYLSRWTREPLNLFLKGESTIGKTYITKNTIRILGEDKDVWYLGGLSPTALVHDYGVLKDESGLEIDVLDMPSRRKIRMENPNASREEVERLYREELASWSHKLRGSYYEVDLQNKLLVFLEPPHIETFNKLRPILSHDTWRISYRFTDKTKTGQLRTTNVAIQGWPATIFCTSEEEYLHDLSTRSLTATPSLSDEKIKAAVTLSSDRAAYGEDLLEPDAQLLREIRVLMDKVKVKAPKTVLTPLCHELQSKIGYWGRRVMRDWPHFLTLVKMNALLNFEDRPKIYDDTCARLIATAEDYLTVLKFWGNIEETTVTGVSGSALNVFHKLIKPLGPLTNYAMLSEKSLELYGESLSSSTLSEYVKVLKSVGLVDTYPDPEDKRRKIIKVIGEGKRLLEITSENFSQEFRNIFTPEKLKEWQNGLSELFRRKGLSYKIVFPDGETPGPTNEFNMLYQKFIYIKSGFPEITLQARKEYETDEKAENNSEISNRDKTKEFRLDRITSILFPTEKCAKCGGQPVAWQITHPDGSWELVCEKCAETLGGGTY
jgi:hypothetical protein